MVKNTKLGKIAWILDDQLYEAVQFAKPPHFARLLRSLRKFTDIQFFNPDVSELEVLDEVESGKFNLVLLPHEKYFKWSRIDPALGANRVDGSALAGYTTSPLSNEELVEDKAPINRRILLDFSHLHAGEISTLVLALAQAERRSGIRSLLKNDAQVYYENWYSQQGMGERAENVLKIPEVQLSDWNRRANSVRICLMSLWSLIYEEGPGKGELAQAIATQKPRAYFQVGADTQTLLLRLIYSCSNRAPKETLQSFSTSSRLPTAPTELLSKYSDFLRVNTIVKSTQGANPEADIEITVGFFASAPSDISPHDLRTLWIDTLSPKLVKEPQYETPKIEKLSIKSTT